MSDNPQSIAVSTGESEIRADRFLSDLPEINSRTRAAKLIEMGMVSYSGGKVIKKSSEKIKPNREIIVVLPVTESIGDLVPLDIPLDIVFEDSDLLVVNKPAGLVVHPAAGHQQDTLVNALIHHVEDLAMGFGEHRPGIVHRLDKDTSGLLVVAKNDAAQKDLARQFKAKSVHRIYNALVYGTPKTEQGTIETSLIRHPTDRKRFCSEKEGTKEEHKGKWAITHYKLINKYASGLSLLECQLETGRTHQIRVHLSEMGHSLISDRVYGSDKRAKNLKSSQLRGMINKLQRIGLHAKEIGFDHPTTGKTLMFSSDWPQDMKHIFDFIERD